MRYGAAKGPFSFSYLSETRSDDYAGKSLGAVLTYFRLDDYLAQSF